MMKKILLILMLLTLVIAMCACGNKDIFDTEYTFDYAMISMPDGTTITVDIESWTDFEGEQIQIKATDGTLYLVNSVNCVLIKKAN